MLDKAFVAFTAVTTTILGSGCPVGAFLPESETRVRLVNEADFEVEVQLFYSDDQNALQGLIQEFGTERNESLGVGDTASFSRDCDDLQAIFINDADLNIIGSIGPEASTDVFRDGSDFNCGDTLTFTFTQNATATDLDIAFSQSN